MVDRRSRARIATGWTANLPGARSDHRLIVQTLHMQDVNWNEDELRRRGRQKLVRWKLPDDKINDDVQRLTSDVRNYKVCWGVAEVM